jgi:hypothetical protein
VSTLESGFPADVDIGDNVTIGHGALLTSCSVGDRVLIGQGAIIQEGCVVESDVIVGAGAVVAPGTLIPSGQMWAGNPAKFIRAVNEHEMENFVKVEMFKKKLEKEPYNDISSTVYVILFVTGNHCEFHCFLLCFFFFLSSESNVDLPSVSLFVLNVFLHIGT